jgi:hypothetical protein
MERFKIPVIPQTTNRCIRFPNEMIDAVQKVIEGKRTSFSAFVMEAVRVALVNLEEEGNNDT